jgi:hypothetical protein
MVAAIQGTAKKTRSPNALHCHGLVQSHGVRVQYAEQNKRHPALGGSAMCRRLEQITFAAFMGSLVTLLILLYADVPLVGF